MSDEAATPAGGAEVSARPDASAKPSVHERLKAALFTTQEPEPDAERPVPQRQEQQEPAEAKASPEPQRQAEASKEAEGEPDKGAQEEEQEATFQSLSELAEGLGWDLNQILDLETATKIDGKEGKARLRDLIKSYQLDGHLNQKLMTHAEEKKAFETERQNFIATSQQKLQQLDAGVKIAQKLLDGEFSSVNWQELQDQDPVAFAQKFAWFQQRQAQINHVANLLGQEHKQSQQQAELQRQTYLQEQMTLLESKVPEWSTKAARDKALTELGAVFSDAYGITPEQLGKIGDHRMLLVARDAWQWQKLQKSKPATLNKVKAAPRLLKPGTQQSRASQEGLQLQQDRERLRKSGKVQDAKHVLKKLIFQ